MKRTKYVDIVVIAFLVITVCKTAFCWDNAITHRDLAEYAAYSSILRMCNSEADQNCDYLKNLGFNKGLDKDELVWNGNTTIKRGYIKDWLREGAFLEDAGSYFQGFIGMARYNNHFHNPLKPWGSAGLNDLGYTGESSILWAQYGSWQAGYIEGDWSWKKTRECYYSALTAKNDIDKQANFAQMFRGLGHQMHLIQDSSVPAHARNDAHPRESILGTNPLTGDYYFETWAKKNGGIVISLALTPISPQVRLDISQYGFVPISQFTDTEQYTGSSPSASLTWGLSEYTNSNFLSDGTIFTENLSSGDGHYFPFPRYNGQCYELVTEHLSASKNRTYLRKKCEGEPVNHFAAISPFYNFLGIFAPSLQRTAFVLDAAAHFDYAALLIPRAVGYSAGLLNYFFRGQVEFNKEIYEQVTGQGIAGLSLAVKNSTPDEEMKDGQVVISYKYKPAGQTEFTYGLSDPVASGSVPYQSEAFYSFTFPTPVPADATDIQYLWAFEGTLGQEVGAVVGSITPQPCRITGEWREKQDEGVSMTLTQIGSNITGTYTDLLVYCSPNNYVSCGGEGGGVYDSSTRGFDLTFNINMNCCCPQIVYESTLITCDCMAGRLSSVCNPSTDATFVRSGSGALCPFP